MDKTVYQGVGVLESLQEAINYNNALLNLVLEAVPSLRLDKSLKVLDFGSGVGTFSDMLTAQGINTECFDIDQQLVSNLHLRGYTAYSSFDTIKDEKYDVIVSFNVFEHIKDDKHIFSELTKKLKSNGRMVIFVPAFNLLYSSFDAELGHVRRYSMNSLGSMIDASFEVKHISYFDTIGFFAALYFKFFVNNSKKVTKRNIAIFDRLIFPLNKVLDPIFSRVLGKNVFCILEKK